jgi:hypothetical protein
LGSGGLLALSDQLAGQRWKVCRAFRSTPLPAFIALAEFSLLLGAHPHWKDGTKKETNLLRDVLALTEPDDYILDSKAETVFRRRCFRPVLERITMKAVQRGIIIDDAPKRCVETNTCVVSATILRRLSPATREFVERNYQPVTDSLRVAGLALEPSAKSPRRSDFEIVIPASYEIISRDGSVVSGTLDGTPYDGPRFIAAGPHSFESTSISRLVLLWARAADRDFTPFDRDMPRNK